MDVSEPHMSFDSFPNRLPVYSYEGTIDGIAIRWGDGAIANLPDNASGFNADQSELKGATEHLAHASAKRLGKTRVRIMYVVIHALISIISPVSLLSHRGSFHTTTTITATGMEVPDDCHCSIVTAPGQAKIHIYVTLSRDIALHDMEVLGESVVRPGQTTPDPTLSTGIRPPW